jgi:hypothetical protein
MIPINSIEIPVCFKAVCAIWGGNMDCSLRRIHITGRLAVCPGSPGRFDSREEWYLALWRKLSRDIEYIADGWRDSADASCMAGLNAFRAWTDWQVILLEQSYGLSDWVDFDG